MKKNCVLNINDINYFEVCNKNKNYIYNEKREFIIYKFLMNEIPTFFFRKKVVYI